MNAGGPTKTGDAPTARVALETELFWSLKSMTATGCVLHARAAVVRTPP